MFKIKEKKIQTKVLESHRVGDYEPIELALPSHSLQNPVFEM